LPKDGVLEIAMGGHLRSLLIQENVVFGPLPPLPAGSGLLNVKNFGAKGDARFFSDGDSLAGNILSSASANFSDADVGKIVWGVENASGIARIAQGFVAEVLSATEIVVDSPNFNFGYSNLYCVVGTDDSDALIAAYQAATLLRTGSSDTGIFASIPGVYLPTGGYIIQKPVFFPNPTQEAAGQGLPLPSFIGDGENSTTFYPSPDYNFSDPNFVAQRGMINVNTGTGGVAQNQIGNFGVNGSGFGFTIGLSAAFIDASDAYYVHDIVLSDVQGFQVGGVWAVEGAGGIWRNIRCFNLNASGTAILAEGGQLIVINCFGSNGYKGQQYINFNQGTSYADVGDSLTLINGINDEGSATPQLEFINCSNTSVHGGTYFGNATSLPCHVDGTSDVSFFGTTIGPFSYRDNSDAMLIDAGGIGRFSGCRIHSTGTGTALTVNGTAYDLGGNIFTSVAGSGVGPVGTIPELAADPPTGGLGVQPLMWFNTTDGLFKIWNGAAIKTVTVT
jgi:hypothetical protein